MNKNHIYILKIINSADDGVLCRKQRLLSLVYISKRNSNDIDLSIEIESNGLIRSDELDCVLADLESQGYIEVDYNKSLISPSSYITYKITKKGVKECTKTNYHNLFNIDKKYFSYPLRDIIGLILETF